MSTKHQFHLYHPEIARCIATDQFTSTDVDITHRVSRVLRLVPGQEVSFFDGTCVVVVLLEVVSKKEVIGRVTHREYAAPTPSIEVIVPIFKREALEAVIYNSTELGATRIVVCPTDAGHTKWFSHKAFDRLPLVVRAACEQAKRVTIPVLVYASTFSDAVALYAQWPGHRVWCHEAGTPCHTVIKLLDEKKDTVITAGPEAGFTEDERALLRAHSFVPLRLTNSILRAWHALTLAVGLVSALYHRDS